MPLWVRQSFVVVPVLMQPGSSDFCGLFTQGEWEGYEYTLDIEYYYE